jgi:hypothetical protein
MEGTTCYCNGFNFLTYITVTFSGTQYANYKIISYKICVYQYPNRSRRYRHACCQLLSVSNDDTAHSCVDLISFKIFDEYFTVILSGNMTISRNGLIYTILIKEFDQGSDCERLGIESLRDKQCSIGFH